MDAAPLQTAPDRDFGAFEYDPPIATATPLSDADVTGAFAQARRRGLKIGFRGAGHSCHGQTSCPGGLLVRNFGETAHWQALDDEWIRVDTRSNWRTLERELNAVGRAVPVVTDYLGLSVGGTLAVGGFGVDSLTRGSQVDHVARVELIATDGSHHIIGRDTDPELFRFALAARGRLGLVCRVDMKTKRYRRFNLRQQFVYRSVDRLLDLIETLAELQESPARFHGGMMFASNVVFAELGQWHDTPAHARSAPPPDYLAHTGAPAVQELVHDIRFADDRRIATWVDSFGACRRMWADYMLPPDAVRTLAHQVEAMRLAGAFGQALRCVYFGIVAPPAAPGFAFDTRGTTTTERRVGMGLYAMVDEHDERTAALIDTAYQRCQARCLELGGRPYLYGRTTWTEASWEHCYGSAPARLRQLRKRFDPGSMIATGDWRPRPSR